MGLATPMTQSLSSRGPELQRVALRHNCDSRVAVEVVSVMFCEDSLLKIAEIPERGVTYTGLTYDL